MVEIWFDDKYKYEVELVERISTIQNDKITEWVEKYKVILQTERSKK